MKNKKEDEFIKSLDKIKLTRREFLKLGAIAGGVVATSGFFLKGAFASQLEALQELKSTAGFKEIAAGLIPAGCHICGAICPILAETKDGRVIRTYGNSDERNIYSYGNQCPKGKSGIQQVYSPDRLKYPMKRVGEGKFVRISWAEAFDFIADKLIKIEEKYGENAVYVLWGKHPQGDIQNYFWKNTFGTKNVFGHDSLCDAARRIAGITTFGDKRPLPDFKNTKLAVLFGMNPFETTKFLWYCWDLTKALENGAKVVVIDPRFTETAAKALEHGGEWIPINPGTDGALALAMAYHIFTNEEKYSNLIDPDFVKWNGSKFIDSRYTYGLEKYRNYVLGIQDKTPGNDGIAKTPEWAEKITSVPAATIRRLADELMTIQQAYCDAWTGVAHRPNGVYASRAIFSLCGLIGGFDTKGGLIRRNGGKLKAAKLNKIPEAEYHKNGHPETLHHAAGLTNFVYHDMSGFPPEAILDPGFAKKEYEKTRGKGTYPKDWPEEYPVKALITWFRDVANSNPNTERWIKALKKLSQDSDSLFVDINVFISNAGQYADIILPECTYLERNDIRAQYSLYPYLSMFREVIPPMYESKKPYEIVYGLIDALASKGYKNKGWNRKNVAPWKDYEEAILHQLDIEQRDGTKVTWEYMKKQGLWFSDDSTPNYRGYRKEGFKTDKHGKSTKTFDYYSEDLAGSSPNPNPTHSLGNKDVKKHWPFAPKDIFNGLPVYKPSKYSADGEIKPSSQYPFVIVCGGRVSEHRFSNTENLPWLMEMYPENTLRMNAGDARRLGIKSDDYVFVENPMGKKIKIKVEVAETIMSGVVQTLNGFGHISKWMRTSYKKGANVNILTDNLNYCPISGMEGSEEMIVKISKVMD